MRPMEISGVSESLRGSRTRGRISHGLSAIAWLCSSIILLGMSLKFWILQRIIPETVLIHQHTAATFIAISFAILMSPWERKWQQRLAMVLAVLSVTVGSLRIYAAFSRRWLWVGDALPGHGPAVMAVSTAIVFVCLGIGCLCMMAAKGRNWMSATLLALFAIGFGSIAAFGHLFRASALYVVTGQVMSLPTALLTLLVALSLISSRPPVGIASLALDGIGSRWLNLPIRYKCLAVVALPVTCLVFEIAWQMRVLRALEDAQHWTAHTRQVLLTAADLRNLLLQVEANARGYGLTGRAEFLPPFHDAEINAPLVAEQLSKLVKDNPIQLARSQELQELTRLKLEVAHTNVVAFIANRSTVDPKEMTERMLQGKAKMDEFNSLAKIFVAEEDLLLAERMRRMEQQQILSRRVLALAVGTGVGSGLLAVFLFSMSVAKRLSTLQFESRRIADGELMPIPHAGRDEISALAGALHSASKRIHEQVQTLEALNSDLESFSYSVSHDLRSPLRHIHGFSKILQSDFAAELPAEAQRYLSRIENGAERMGRLIDDLLNFARIGRRELDRQAVSLRPLVQSVAGELTGGSDREVEWQIAALPAVYGDPALIKQVFANLLGNAVKFTRTRERARIEVGSLELQQGTAIYVRDNGVGFDMKFADKLFGVFQRLHRLEEFEGTGVGLATVARIVHKHGGSVWAEAAPDQGASFYFTLGEIAAAEPERKRQTQNEVLYATAR